MSIIEKRKNRQYAQKEIKEKNVTGCGIIIRGTIIAIVATIVMLLIFSTILTYSDVGEETIDTVIIVVTGMGIFIGSSIATSRISKNGIYNGGLIGATYIISIYLISSFFYGNFALEFKSLVMVIIGILFGIVGGIIGVNKK